MSLILSHISYKKWTWDFLWLSLDKIGTDWSSFRQKHNIIGKGLTLTKTSEHKTCTWWYDLATMISSPCPKNTKLYWSSKVCESCERRTWFSPFFYNQDKISDAQKKYNATPHLVYLAYFGWDLVKIWITSERRGLARIMEQWALMWTIISHHDTAEEARKIEAVWATYAWCKELVHASRKLWYLVSSEVDFDRGEELFDKKLTLLSQWLDIDFPRWTFWKNETYLKFIHLLTDVTHNISKKDRFSWKILGVIWSIAFVEQWSHYMLYNLKPRIGHEIELSEHVEEMWGLVSQWSLF